MRNPKNKKTVGFRISQKGLEDLAKIREANRRAGGDLATSNSEIVDELISGIVEGKLVLAAPVVECLYQMYKKVELSLAYFVRENYAKLVAQSGGEVEENEPPPAVIISGLAPQHENNQLTAMQLQFGLKSTIDGEIQMLDEMAVDIPSTLPSVIGCLQKLMETYSQKEVELRVDEKLDEIQHQVKA